MAYKIKLEPNELKNTIMNPKWVKEKPNEELVEIILALGKEIYNRITTQVSGISDQIKQLDFVPVKVSEVEVFIRVPKSKSAQLSGQKRRLLLAVPGTMIKPIGLEIMGNIVIGRGGDEQKIDLDLTDLGATNKGVSRRHAIIQIISNLLYISDAGSTNGTYLNGNRIAFGNVMPVEDGDVISFGSLHLKIIMVGSK
jgi:hypothetical protein